MTFQDRMFRHPYLYSGAVLAKACTLLATAIWCLVVITRDQALALNPNYAHLLRLIPNEDTWAWCLLLLLAPMCWRLYSCSRPHWYSILGYAVLALFWAYLWWGIIMSGRAWPTAAASSTVMLLLSLSAFIANPRISCPTCGGPRPEGTCPLTGKPCGNARRFDGMKGRP